MTMPEIKCSQKCVKFLVNSFRSEYFVNGLYCYNNMQDKTVIQNCFMLLATVVCHQPGIYVQKIRRHREFALGIMPIYCLITYVCRGRCSVVLRILNLRKLFFNVSSRKKGGHSKQRRMYHIHDMVGSSIYYSPKILYAYKCCSYITDYYEYSNYLIMGAILIISTS